MSDRGIPAKRGGVALASAFAMVLATGPSLLAQDGSEAPVDDAAAQAAVSDTVADEAIADLWALSSSGLVTRLDGETGAVVSQVDATTEDCRWERLVGPVDGAVWVMDDGAQGGTDAGTGEQVRVGRFCFGRIPVDGQAVEVHSIKLPNGVRIDGAAVSDGNLWVVVGGASDLLRADITGGPGTLELEFVRKGVDDVAVIGDQLVIISDPRNRSKGKPATVDASGKVTSLDVGLKGKEVAHSVTAFGAHALFEDQISDRLFAYDSATGTLTRPKATVAPDEVAVTDEGVWLIADGDLALVRPDGDGGAEAQVADACSGSIICDIFGVSPGAVWVFQDNVNRKEIRAATGEITREEYEAAPDWVLRRVDTATLETTAEVDGMVAR